MDGSFRLLSEGTTRTAPRGGRVKDCEATAAGGDAEGVVLDASEHGAKLDQPSEPNLTSHPISVSESEPVSDSVSVPVSESVSVSESVLLRTERPYARLPRRRRACPDR